MIATKVYHKSGALLRYGWNDVFHPRLKLQEDRILVFHGVDDVGNHKINSRFISSKRLESLIGELKKLAEIVTLQEMFENEQSASHPRISLTFDDGYRSMLTHLVPILERQKVPATVFITTAGAAGMDVLWPDHLDLSVYVDHTPFQFRGEKYVYRGRKGYYAATAGKYLKQQAKESDRLFLEELMKVLPGASRYRENETLNIYWNLLTEAEIKKLSQSAYITIGSHTVFHSNLPVISPENALLEMTDSKKYLENSIQKKVDFFAYPYGNYTLELAEIVGEAGYKYQLLGDFIYTEHIQRPDIKKRFVTNPYISDYNQVYCMVKKQVLVMVDIAEITFVHLSEDNIHLVPELFTKVFKKKISPRDIKNKYDYSGIGKPYLGILAIHQGKAVGFIGICYIQLMYGGRTEWAADFTDSMVDSEYQKSGIYLLLLEKLEYMAAASGLSCSFGFANKNSYHPVVNKRKWNLGTKLKGYSFPVRVVPLQKIAYKLGFQKYYDRWAGRKLNDLKVSFTDHFFNDNDQLPHIVHDRFFFEKRSKTPVHLLMIKNIPVWVKTGYQLSVGYVSVADDEQLITVITALKQLASRLYISEVMIQVSENSYLDQALDRYFPHFESWTVVYKNYCSEFPVHHTRFQFCDTDSF